MNKALEQRLTELKAEYESGQKMMAETEASLANMSQSMLRISGAIQVLEEMLAEEESAQGDGEAKPKVAAKADPA